ncbi:MAG: glycosyltransferase [Thermodesulfobacteriota bacterium]
MKPTPLRIAMLSLHSSPFGELGTRDTGGMSVYVRELAGELGRLGHRVDVFTRRPVPHAPRVQPMGPNVRLVHLDGGEGVHDGKLGLYPGLSRFLASLESFRGGEGGRYDLVHSHYWLSGCLGAGAAGGWGVPHVVMFHTWGAAKNRASCGENEPALRLDAERELARTCDRVVAPTARERDELLRTGVAPPDRVTVIPCGVDLERFRPLDRAESRRCLGLERGGPILLYVGRFVPVKGADRLLEALAHLAPRPDLRLVLVGGDGLASPTARALEERARALGLAGSIGFRGRVDQEEMPSYYAAADLLVVPSHYESFGLATLEALACGTPVASTRVGAAQDLLDPAINGVLLDPEPAALARGLDAALGRGLSGAWPRAGVRASVAAYGWPRVAEAVLAMYRDVLSGAGAEDRASKATSGAHAAGG